MLRNGLLAVAGAILLLGAQACVRFTGPGQVVGDSRLDDRPAPGEHLSAAERLPAESGSCTAPGTRPPAGSLTESFDSLTASKWFGTPSPACSFTTEAGQAVIRAHGGEAAYCKLTTVQTFDLRGSQLLVQVPQLAAAAVGLQTYVYLTVGAGKIYVGVENGNWIAGTSQALPLLITKHDSTQHRWWRLREQQGTLSLEAAASGTGPFDLVGTWPDPACLDSVAVELGVGNYTGVATTPEARFDCVNLPSGC